MKSGAVSPGLVLLGATLLLLAVIYFAAQSPFVPRIWPWSPPILRGAHCVAWRNCNEASRKLERALKQQFPLGSSKGNLKSVLVQQGFQPLPISVKECTFMNSIPTGEEFIDCPAWNSNWSARRYLSYSWGLLPCGADAVVLWDADSKGRLTHLAGGISAVCL